LQEVAVVDQAGGVAVVVVALLVLDHNQYHPVQEFLLQ
jgi:hypothetical protein